MTPELSSGDSGDEDVSSTETVETTTQSTREKVRRSETGDPVRDRARAKEDRIVDKAENGGELEGGAVEVAGAEDLDSEPTGSDEMAVSPGTLTGTEGEIDTDDYDSRPGKDLLGEQTDVGTPNEQIGGTRTGATPVQMGTERGGLSAGHSGAQATGEQFRESAVADVVEDRLADQGLEVDLTAEDVTEVTADGEQGFELTEGGIQKIAEQQEEANLEVDVASDVVDTVGDAVTDVTDPTGEFLGDVFGDEPVGKAGAILSLPAVPVVAAAKEGSEAIDEFATEVNQFGTDVRQGYKETVRPYSQQYQETVREPVVQSAAGESVTEGVTSIRSDVLEATQVDESVTQFQDETRATVFETAEDVSDEAGDVVTGTALAATTTPEPISTAVGLTTLGGAAVLSTTDPFADDEGSLQPTEIPIPQDVLEDYGQGEIAVPDDATGEGSGEIEAPTEPTDETSGEIDVPEEGAGQGQGEIEVPAEPEDAADPGTIRVANNQGTGQMTIAELLEEEQQPEETDDTGLPEESPFKESTGANPDELRGILDIGDGTTIGEIRSILEQYDPQVLQEYEPVRTGDGGDTVRQEAEEQTEGDTIREIAEEPQATTETVAPPGTEVPVAVILAEDAESGTLSDAAVDVAQVTLQQPDLQGVFATPAATPTTDQAQDQQAVQDQTVEQTTTETTTTEYPTPVGYPPEFGTGNPTEEPPRYPNTPANEYVHHNVRSRKKKKDQGEEDKPPIEERFKILEDEVDSGIADVEDLSSGIDMPEPPEF